MTVDFKRLEPKSNIIKSIVVFFHGYGADGADLLSIGNALSEHLPDTLFVAPDAPTKCQMSPFGFQWFPIPDMDGSSEIEAIKELDRICTSTNQWIDELIEKENVKAQDVFLFGFSQGTMLSLYLGPQRLQALGGIIGFSGKLINIDSLKSKISSKPPILLIHGDEDPVVSPLSLPEAVKELKLLNFEVRHHVSIGVAHGIAPDGLAEALKFLHDKME
jgi:phospholipase/carboxylesterase